MESLAPGPGDVVVDCTLGRGGHAIELGRRIGPDGLIVGFDRDPDNLSYARSRLEKEGIPCLTIHDSFVSITRHLAMLERRVDVILADLGVSSNQLDTATRGFGFQDDSPLDMRLDHSADNEHAGELLAPNQSAGTGRAHPRLWRGPVCRLDRPQDRPSQGIRTDHDHTPAFESGQGRLWPQGPFIESPSRNSYIHGTQDRRQRGDSRSGGPARSVQSGLRDGIKGWLDQSDGRIGIISFHSLEDRPVKQTFSRWQKQGLATGLTSGVVRPGEAEIKANPRSRSAKFRAVQVTGPNRPK